MLILANTADALTVQLQTVPTAAVSVYAAFREVTDGTASTYAPRSSALTVAGTALTTLLAGPSAGLVRVVDSVLIHNPSGNAAITITVSADVGGVVAILAQAVLGPEERLAYENGAGWQAYTNTGAVKTTQNVGSVPQASGISVVTTTATTVITNAAANVLQDITGLVIPLAANQRTFFRATILYASAATTTGARFTLRIPGGAAPSLLGYNSSVPQSTTAFTFGLGSGAVQLPTTTTNSSAVTGASNLAVVEGIVQVPTADTLQFQGASEVANSAITTQIGSHVLFYAV